MRSLQGAIKNKRIHPEYLDESRLQLYIEGLCSTVGVGVEILEEVNLEALSLVGDTGQEEGEVGEGLQGTEHGGPGQGR